jgi:3-hydroxyisobutyrate dehydrogenase
MSDALAFIGLGHMGAPMVARLLGGGHAVRVFDLDADALARAAEHGAQVATSAGDAALGAGVVFTSLPGPAAVERVVGEVLETLAPGGAIVDVSTIDPATARRLHQRVDAAGSGFIDAPVSGGVMKAHDGTLTIMAGGEAGVLDRCRFALSLLGAEIVHVGGPGAGQMTKLCNNALCATILAGMAETFAAGRRAGLDPHTLASVVGKSSGGNWMLENWLPLTAFAGDYTPRFALDLMAKDVRLFTQSAQELGAPVPVTAAMGQTLALAQAQGLGGLDMTVLMEVFDDLAQGASTEVAKRCA